MTATTTRRRGRPALADQPPAADEALLDRALEAFAERGFEGASLSGFSKNCSATTWSEIKAKMINHISILISISVTYIF